MKTNRPLAISEMGRWRPLIQPARTAKKEEFRSLSQLPGRQPLCGIFRVDRSRGPGNARAGGRRRVRIENSIGETRWMPFMSACKIG